MPLRRRMFGVWIVLAPTKTPRRARTMTGIFFACFGFVAVVEPTMPTARPFLISTRSTRTLVKMRAPFWSDHGT